MVDQSQAIQDYCSTLEELAVNSKPHINMLTMLAEENQACSSRIAECIESHIQKVGPTQKLPALYLIDSIVKNCLETDYKDLFARNIISIFVHVFKEADEKQRQSMFKLRQTWAGIFPPSRLYGIDIKVSAVDPAWPVTAPQQQRVQGQAALHPTIHVNPRFLNPQTSIQIQAVNHQTKTPPVSVSTPPKTQTHEQGQHQNSSKEQPQSKLHIRENELKRLQQKRDALEKTKAQIAEIRAEKAKQQQQPQSVVVRARDPRKRPADRIIEVEEINRERDGEKEKEKEEEELKKEKRRRLRDGESSRDHP